MIEETLFTKDTLISMVKEKYGIEVTEVSKLNKGSANLYSLNNTYILKEFQSKYTYEDISKEITIVNHLKNNGISVPEYIITKNNEYSFVYKGKVIILQKFIDGYTMEANTANFEQMMESARELGRIVKSLETIKIDLPIVNVSSLFSTEAINKGIEKHKDLLNKVIKDNHPQIFKDLEDKIEMLEYVKSNITFDGVQNLTIMNTHGDYSVLQFIYQDNKIKAVIDFASACKMPIAWEVIRSYSYIDAKAKDGKIDIENLISYVEEFNKYVKLNKYDMKYMPHLYLVQLLSSTFGYKQYIEDNKKESLLDFAFFRTKLCKYLFDNMEFIVKRLEQEII